jgi:hypothetical protein
MRLTVLKTFTILWLFGMYLMLLVTFMTAYQSPEKSVKVTINQQSEAEIEFFMLTGALFVSTLGTLMIITDIKRDYGKRIADRFLEQVSKST